MDWPYRRPQSARATIIISIIRIIITRIAVITIMCISNIAIVNSINNHILSLSLSWLSLLLLLLSGTRMFSRSSPLRVQEPTDRRLWYLGGCRGSSQPIIVLCVLFAIYNKYVIVCFQNQRWDFKSATSVLAISQRWHKIRRHEHICKHGPTDRRLWYLGGRWGSSQGLPHYQYQHY